MNDIVASIAFYAIKRLETLTLHLKLNYLRPLEGFVEPTTITVHPPTRCFAPEWSSSSSNLSVPNPNLLEKLLLFISVMTLVVVSSTIFGAAVLYLHPGRGYYPTLEVPSRTKVLCDTLTSPDVPTPNASSTPSDSTPVLQSSRTFADQAIRCESTLPRKVCPQISTLIARLTCR